jgi:hypothetical protein
MLENWLLHRLNIYSMSGFRVVYYYLDTDHNLYLMSIYSKSEMESIREERLIDILKENGLV